MNQPFVDGTFNLLRHGETSLHEGHAPWVNMQKLLAIIDHQQSMIELLVNQVADLQHRLNTSDLYCGCTACREAEHAENAD